MEKINIEIASGSPVYCPYTGVNLMQDFEEKKAPNTLLLGMHWEVPDMPFYIVNSIEEEFLKLMVKYNYQVVDAVANLDDILSDYEGIIVLNVTSKGVACGPVHETVTFVLAQIE